jgi:hypothetical protein
MRDDADKKARAIVLALQEFLATYLQAANGRRDAIALDALTTRAEALENTIADALRDTAP